MYFFFKLFYLLNYKMNNQMLFMLGGLVALVVVLVVVFMPSVETYTNANLFSSGNKFLTIDEQGKIALQPVVDVDNAIDAAADSVATDVAAIYKTKASASADKTAAAAAYQTKASASVDKTAAAAAYQPMGDYVKTNINYHSLLLDHHSGIIIKAPYS